MNNNQQIHHVYNRAPTKKIYPQLPPKIGIDPDTNFLVLRSRNIPRNPGIFNVVSGINEQDHSVENEKETNYKVPKYSDLYGNTEKISITSNSIQDSKKVKKYKINLIKAKSYILHCLILLIALLTIIISIILLFQNITVVTELSINDKLSSELYSLANEFTNQPTNVWTNIVAGTRDYCKREPQQPLILLLFAKNSSNTVPECLATILANKLVHFIKNYESVKPTILDAVKLQYNDFGELFEELKATLISHKVLVINNLQELPGSMALSLFALCDRYNPAVKDAVLIFTLHGESEGIHESDSAEVEKILHNLWQFHVPQDKLSALVTRVTSRVVLIASENQLSDLCVYVQRES